MYRALAMALGLTVVAGNPCQKAPLPTDFDIVDSVERIDFKETHITGEYRLQEGRDDVYDTNDAHIHHNMTLNNIRENGYLRVAASHVNGIVFRVTLYKNNDRVNVTDVGRNLVARLEQWGRYRLEFRYQMVIDPKVCQTVHIEMALAYDRILRGTATAKVSESEGSSATCPKEQGAIELDIVKSLRDKDPDSVADGGVLSPADLHGALPPQQMFSGRLKVPEGDKIEHQFFPLGNKEAAEFSYLPIRLPHVLGHRSEWLIKVALSTDFALGGGITAVITVGSFKKNEVCGEQEFTQCLDGTKDIIVARATRGQWKNLMTLQAVLSARREAEGEDHTELNTYQLWVFTREQPFQFDFNSCLEYHAMVSVTLVDENEDMLNCDTFPFPEDLNAAPGFYDSLSGTMSVYQNVAIDRDTGLTVSTLRPVKDSIFRVYVEHPSTPISIALKRIEADDLDPILAYETGFEFDPRGIVWYVAKDEQYQLYFEASMSFNLPPEFDSDWTPFCESFVLTAEVIPLDHVPVLDYSTRTEVSPEDTRFIQFQLLTGPDRTLTYDTVETGAHQFFKRLESPRATEVARLQFEVLEESNFQLTIERDFAIADVVADLTLETDSGDETDTLHSTSLPSQSQLSAVISPGNYTLHLHTGYVQNFEDDETWFDSFPKGIAYDLQLFIGPVKGATGSARCPELRRIPEQIILDTPSHHVFERYLVPSTTFAETEVTAAVSTVLHLQISETNIPVTVELHVQEDGAWRLLNTSSEEDEVTVEDLYEGFPWLFASLSAGGHYKLRFVFPSETSETCSRFLMQLSTAPLESGDEQSCTVEAIPDDLLSGKTLPINLTSTFRQTRDHTHVSFSVQEDVEFRAIVRYNFKFQHVYLDVCKCTNGFDACYDCGSFRGTAVFNGEEIATQKLRQGNYVLKVYQSESTAEIDRQTCETYQLHIMMDNYERASKKAAAGHDCTLRFLPKSLNIPGQLADGAFHSVGVVRLPHETMLDATQFSLENAVVFRSYVAPSVDIEGVVVSQRLVRLKAGTTEVDESWQPAVDGTNVAEEGSTLVLLLMGGTFRFQLEYTTASAVMPRNDGLFHRGVGMECVSASIEIAMTPVGMFSAEGLKDTCAPFEKFPVSIPASGVPHAVRRRPIGVGDDFVHSIPFRLATSGTVEFDLYSTFETGSLHIHIMKKDEDDLEQESGAGEYTRYYPERYLDRDYLKAALGPGSYVVMVRNTSHDIVKGVSDDQLVGCQNYSVALRLPTEGGGTESPSTSGTNICEPHPLFPEGIKEYEIEEGTVKVVSGETFSFLTKAGSNLGTVTVPMKVRSLVRLWTHTHNADVNIAVELAESSFDQLIASGDASTSHVETLLVDLDTDPDTDGYYASVVIAEQDRTREWEFGFDCDQFEDLTTFDFAVGVMTRKEAYEATTCRDTTSIQDSFSLSAIGINEIGTLVFDSNQTRFDINFTVDRGIVSGDLTVSLTYNFVLLAVKAEMYNVTDGEELIKETSPEFEDEKGSTVLKVGGLSTGNYRLVFRNLDGPMDMLQFRPHCFVAHFDIQASATQVGVPEDPPRITSIEPKSLTGFVPVQPLELTLSFSETVLVDEDPQEIVGPPIEVTCSCPSGSDAACTESKLMIESMHREPKSVTFRMIDQAHTPLRWGVTCRVTKIRPERFKTEEHLGSSMAYTVMAFECKDPDCRYDIVAGACNPASGLCYAGGMCPPPLAAGQTRPRCTMCEVLTVDPVTKICPRKVVETLTPDSVEKGTLAPRPPSTFEPTSVPPTETPFAIPHVITPKPHTNAPSPDVPPTTSPTTGAPHTSAPHTPAPATSAPVTPKPVTKDDEEDSNGGSYAAVAVVAVVVVVAGIIVGIYWRSRSQVSTQFGGSYNMQEDDDDNLFDDDEEVDEIDPAAPAQRPEV